MPRLRPIAEKPVPALTPEKMLFEQPDPEAPKTPVEAKEPEVEVKTKEQAQPEQQTEPERPDNDALLKEVEAYRRSEKLNQTRIERMARERDEAVNQARARDEEVAKFRKESAQSQLDMVATALGAATAEAESAERELRSAMESSDYERAAKAQRQIAKAEANIARLEDGKTQLEAQIKAVPERPATQQQQTPQGVQLPPSAMEFLRKHGVERNERVLRKLGVLHEDLLDEGFTAFTPEYFEEIESRANLRPKTEDADDETPPPPPRKAAQVSAPVTRTVPGTPRRGDTKLTPEEREIAKSAGITETEYARQKQKLAQMRANGQYGDQQ